MLPASDGCDGGGVCACGGVDSGRTSNVAGKEAYTPESCHRALAQSPSGQSKAAV